MTVHLPNSFKPNRYTGPLCAEAHKGDEIITDWEEYVAVTCTDCLQMAYLVDYNHLRSVQHPQPVEMRVHELAKEAGVERSQPVLLVLRNIGIQVKTPASKVHLEGFEHQALVAVLEAL